MSRQIGQAHIETFRAFLASGAELPKGRDGAVNITELHNITGIPKSSFYQNTTIRSLLDGVDGPRGHRPDPTVAASEATDTAPASETQAEKKVQGLERRVSALEQHNAVLVAENSELRRQVKELRLQLGRQDMMIDSGRRVSTPPAEA